MSKPIRTCVYTREKYEKSKLIRLVKEGEVYVIDLEQKAQKRAIYVSKDVKVLDKMEKNKKYIISEDSKSKIKEMIKGGDNFGRQS